MRKFQIVAVFTALLLTPLFFVAGASASHTSTQCERVRALVADNELVLKAAEEGGGLTSADRTWITRQRAVNAAALRHCTAPAPSPSASSVSPSASPSATSTPSTPPLTGFPNASNTGVPAGWVPASTRTTELRVTAAGAVVEDIRIVNANLVIDAPNVTVRRVEIQGGRIINDPGTVCRNGLLLEQVSLVRAPGQVTSGDTPAITSGGYTARRVKIDGLPEGFRVGGKSAVGCTTVTIQDSFARIRYPDQCGDWHGDGIQGYDGPALVVRNSTLELIESGSCGGTASFFYPSGQGNTSADIDGLLVNGGGYVFRLGMPGSVRNLNIVDGSWFYGPIDVKCSALSAWGAQVVTIDSNYQVTGVVRSQSCNTEGGS